MDFSMGKVWHDSIRIAPFRVAATAHSAATIFSILVALHACAGERARAQSFHPIEVSFDPSTQVAVPLDIAPDGSRVGGAIDHYNVDIDCGGLRCTSPFTWSTTSGTNVERYSEQIILYETPYGPLREYAEEIVTVAQNYALANGPSAEPILFSANGHRHLRTLPTEHPGLIARAMSDDGNVIVGWDWNFQNGAKQAFRWTNTTGVQSIVVGEPFSYATGVSGDGHVVVGTSAPTDFGFGNQAFRWSESEGATYLGSISPNGLNVPAALSYDGAVIVGTAYNHPKFQTYRWTKNSGIVPLDIPDGFSGSAAADVAADGQTIVGQLVIGDSRFYSFSEWSDPTTSIEYGEPAQIAEKRHAMIWDSVYGTRVLKDVLTNQFGLGDELAGWSLTSATAISADGKVISGIGVNPAGDYEGWVVTLVPEPHGVVLAVGSFALLMGRRARNWQRKDGKAKNDARPAAKPPGHCEDNSDLRMSSVT